MIKHALFAAALISAPAALMTAPAAMAQDADTRSKLNLSATGEAKAAPDMASISSGVVSQAETAQRALAENSEAMNRVVEALREAGVAEEDIQTSNLSLNPVYANQRDDGGEGPRISGYRADNQVTATVRDLDDLGEAIDAMVQAGANNVNNIQFMREDPTEAMNAARRDAIEKLRDKAQVYAEAGGFELGPIISLSENSYGPPQPYAARMEMAQAADMSTPVQPGELTMSVTVNGVFEIQN